MPFLVQYAAGWSKPERLALSAGRAYTKTSAKAARILTWLSGKLYLLPVRGSDTQWYKNGLKNPAIRIDARDAEAEFRAVPITDAKTVRSVIEKFMEKDGAKDVKKYYSKFDVAITVQLT